MSDFDNTTPIAAAPLLLDGRWYTRSAQEWREFCDTPNHRFSLGSKNLDSDGRISNRQNPRRARNRPEPQANETDRNVGTYTFEQQRARMLFQRCRRRLRSGERPNSERVT